MSNPLIVLNNPQTVADELKSLLAPGEKVYFVVIGNSPSAFQLANFAEQFAEDWRHVLLITVIDFLFELPIAPQIPASQKNGVWQSLGISFDGTIVVINNQIDDTDVVTTFLLTEGFTKEP